MSKVDWTVITLLTTFTCFCFWMDGKGWFFLAGVCTTLIFAIGIGHWLKGAEQHQHEKSWDNFLNKMQEETRLPENNRRQKSLLKSEVAVHHNMF